MGMLGVNPDLQGSGIGKKLLRAAEEHAQKLRLPQIEMTVISVRHDLIDWYKRNGYRDSGERIPFEEDSISGKHLQALEFAVLVKTLLF